MKKNDVNNISNEQKEKKLSTIVEKSSLENNNNKINDITLITPSTNYQDNTIKNINISSLTNMIRKNSQHQKTKSLNYSKSQTNGYNYQDSSENNSSKKNDYNYKMNSDLNISDKIREIDENIKIRESSILCLDNKLIKKKGSIPDDELEALSENSKNLKKEINELKNLKVILTQKLDVNLKRIEERNKKILFLKRENEKLKNDLQFLKDSKMKSEKNIFSSEKLTKNKKKYVTPKNNLKYSFIKKKNNIEKLPNKTIKKEIIRKNTLMDYWQKDLANTSSVFLKKSEDKFIKISKNQNYVLKKENNENKNLKFENNQEKKNINNSQNNYYENKILYKSSSQINYQFPKIIKRSIKKQRTRNFIKYDPEKKNISTKKSENIFHTKKTKNSLTFKKNDPAKNVLKYKVVPNKLSMEETLLSTLTSEIDRSRVISSKNFNEVKNNQKNIFDKDPIDFFGLSKKEKKSIPYSKKSYLIGQTIFSKKKNKSKDKKKIDLNFQNQNFVFEQPEVKRVVSRRDVFN